MSHIEDAKSVGGYRAEPDPTVKPLDLEEFHERHARDTWWARVVLITVVFGMLGLNLWMSERNYEAMIIDVDASREAASEIDEQNTLRLDEIDRRLAQLEARLPAEAITAPTPVAALR